MVQLLELLEKGEAVHVCKLAAQDHQIVGRSGAQGLQQAVPGLEAEAFDLIALLLEIVSLYAKFLGIIAGKDDLQLPGCSLTFHA